MTRSVPDSAAERRQFIPEDPTQDPSFDPAKWTGTILSEHLKLDWSQWFPDELMCLDCGQPITGGQWMSTFDGPRHMHCPEEAP